MTKIRGVIVPSLTFFNKDLEVNTELHSLLTRHLLVNGADSIYLFGTKGAGFYFSDKIEEKIRLINLTLEVTGKKTPLMVGIFGNNKDRIIDQLDELGKKFSTLNFIIAPPYLEKIEDVNSYLEYIFGAVNINNHIYIHNNREEFAGNEINPSIIKELIGYDNFSGFIDSCDNINYCKSYIKLIDEDFSLLCENEETFQKFLQLVPLDLRKYVGIVPCVSNLVNLSSKLYFCAIEEKILELHQLQEQINDIRNKLYDIKAQDGKEQRGLKYAFLYLYKNFSSNSIEDLNILSPYLEGTLDEITKERIEAYVNYLINQKRIYRLFSLGKDNIYQLDDMINIFSNVEVLLSQGNIKKVIGPFDADINTIYRVNFEKNQLIFKFRTLKSFQYENIVKEKLLFPFLDGSLNSNSSDLREKIKKIVSIKKGNYQFSSDKTPIIPVANLVYFDETKEVIPYIFTIQEYFHGKSLKDLFNQYTTEDLSFSKSKFLTLFNNLGELLGKLHTISFDSFQEHIYNIGKKSEINWLELINLEFEMESQEARRKKLGYDNEIKTFLKDNISLLEEENEPVVLHNDFQWTNLIVKDSPTKIQINGIIDFDDWRVGVRAQDFVKMEFFTLKPINNVDIRESFYYGYRKNCNIGQDFFKKLDIYSLLWFLKNYNSLYGNLANLEGSNSINERDKILNSYVKEIERIINS